MLENNENNEQLDNYKFIGTGLQTSEKKWAKKQFNNYRNNNHISTLSDLQLLEELVFRETIQERYKKTAEKIVNQSKTKDQTADCAILPASILKSMDDNLVQILLLKKQLGLLEDKKEDANYQWFAKLYKKFRLWEKDHVAEREVTCPFCSKLFFLHIRTDKYQEANTDWFQNKILGNKHLWKVYKEGKITQVEMADILGVSRIDYVDWLEKKIFKD